MVSLFQPTLLVNILNYTQTFDSKYVEYSMVPTNISGDFDVRLNVLRNNVKPIVDLGVYFENVEFMNKTINVCKVATSRNLEPLLKLIYKVIADKGNLPKECPIKKVDTFSQYIQCNFLNNIFCVNYRAAIPII